MADGGIEVAQEAPGDVRFAHLAKLCGLADATHAIGRMVLLWSACKRREQHVLPEAVIEEVLGPGGGAHLIEAHLGERATGGIRIKGSAERIRWRSRRSTDPGPAIATNSRRGPSWTEEERAIAGRVLGKLKDRSGYNYSAGAATHVQAIVRLLREGYVERDLQRVVWHRCAEWKDNDQMEQYMRPATLFARSNFDNYLPQADAAIERVKRDAEVAERPPEASPFLKEGT